MESQQIFRGRVSFASQERYRVLLDSVEIEAVPAGALRWDAQLPAVGDWVDIRAVDAELGLIERVMPRANAISRRRAGRSHDEQVLAANVDLIVIVMACDRDFNLRRLERYLVLAAECGAPVLVALNKAELCEDPAGRTAEVQAIAPRAECVTLSAIESVASIEPYAAGRTVVLLGSSGVGKSTIVNGLLGDARQATSAIREHDSRGRHTTTHRMLIPLPGGGALIDTPGLRELSLWASPDSLEHAFSDIAALAAACRFRDCRHTNEPGCAVAGALAGGQLAPEHWANYLKLQGEIRYLERAADPLAALAEKKRWKAIHKAMRRRNRNGLA